MRSEGRNGEGNRLYFDTVFGKILINRHRLYHYEWFVRYTTVYGLYRNRVQRSIPVYWWRQVTTLIFTGCNEELDPSLFRCKVKHQREKEPIPLVLSKYEVNHHDIPLLRGSRIQRLTETPRLWKRILCDVSLTFYLERI